MSVPTPPPATLFRPNPEGLALEKGHKDTETALRVLAIASEQTKDAKLSAHQLADHAEILWQWVTTEAWPTKQP